MGVICMQSVFPIVSCNANRRNQCCVRGDTNWLGLSFKYSNLYPQLLLLRLSSLWAWKNNGNKSSLLLLLLLLLFAQLCWRWLVSLVSTLQLCLCSCLCSLCCHHASFDKGASMNLTATVYQLSLQMFPWKYPLCIKLQRNRCKKSRMWDDVLKKQHWKQQTTNVHVLCINQFDNGVLIVPPNISLKMFPLY